MEVPTVSEVAVTLTETAAMMDYDIHVAWVAIKVLSAINSVVFLYVTITQVAYCIARFKRSTERYGNVFNMMCAFASVFVFLRVGFPIEEMVDVSSDINCAVVVVFKTLTYGLALTITWLVLWLRQRVFYRARSLKSLTSPLVKFLSGTTAVVLVFGFVGTQTLYYATQKYEGTEAGCVIAEESYTSYLWAIVFASAGLMQVVLLVLFIYPLIKHKQNMRSSNASSGSSGDSINKVIKRAAITTGICIVMNLISALVKVVTPSGLILIVTYVHDVNLSVELLAVIVAFRSWRERLFPLACKSRNKNESKSFST